LVLAACPSAPDGVAARTIASQQILPATFDRCLILRQRKASGHYKPRCGNKRWDQFGSHCITSMLSIVALRAGSANSATKAVAQQQLFDERNLGSRGALNHAGIRRQFPAFRLRM
jgi:hypothetical protein